MSAAADRPLARKLFEPASIEEQAPAAKVLTYALLLLWALVVLVPLYWVLITSFKGPGEVDNGPFYIPFVDFTPSLAAWDFMLLQNNTLGPYLNSVVVALVSTALAVLIGSLAAYALVRIRFQVKLAAVGVFLLLLVAVIVAIATFGVKWELAIGVAGVLFVIALWTLIGRTKLAVGNNDIEFWIISNRIMPPIVAVLPI
jgi:multiple sugar transport system permease protein